MKAALHTYKNILLPLLKSMTNEKDRLSIEKMKSIYPSGKPIRFLYKQEYKNKEIELETNGYKIVRNVFKDTGKLDNIVRLAELYNVNMQEFVDKDDRFKHYINCVLTDEYFIDEYKKVFQEPFLWQKATIHRKRHDDTLFSKSNFTAEHIDLTETPNSKLTITAYVALTDQDEEIDSRLVLYPKSHLYNMIIPEDNFDYVSTSIINNDVIGNINEIIEYNPGLAWIRECLYHLIILNANEMDILKSTFIIMLYNPMIFVIDPIKINLQKGDVLFFLSDMLHGASTHSNPSRARVSLAVRGGQPYYEPSNLISRYVSESFYEETKTRRDMFLFSGTKSMIEEIDDREKMTDIIYEITSENVN